VLPHVGDIVNIWEVCNSHFIDQWNEHPFIYTKKQFNKRCISIDLDQNNKSHSSSYTWWNSKCLPLLYKDTSLSIGANKKILGFDALWNYSMVFSCLCKSVPCKKIAFTWLVWNLNPSTTCTLIQLPTTSTQLCTRFHGL
jgi:hypothetical protein